MFTLLDESAGLRQVVDAINRILKRDAGVASFGTRIDWTDYTGKALNRQTGAITDNDVPTLTIENGDGEHLLIRKSTDSSTVFEVQDDGVTAPLIIGTTVFDDPVSFYETVTIRDGAAGDVIVFADPANDRLQVGSATALSNAANSRLEVSGGRSYFVPNSEEFAIGLRYRTGNTGNFFLGATDSNTPDFVARRNSGLQIFRALNAGGIIIGTASAMVGSELLRVEGQARIEGTTTITTGGAVITGDTSVSTKLVVGGTTWSGSEELRIVGDSRLEGALVVTTGGLTVTAGGLTVTAGGLTVTAGGALLDAAPSTPTANVGYRESFAKGWVKFNTSGTILTELNISSITDTGAGNWTVNWDRDFSSSDYACVATAQATWAGGDTTTFNAQIHDAAVSGGATQILVMRVSDGALTDPTAVHVVAFGTQ